MNESTIKIFYSWQSDLPGNETRNIIQDAIKDAVKVLRDTVDVEADRDTQGESGSPDIAQTIFSKIDECDIFVADVTAVCEKESVGKNGERIIKKIPNPNVMLELGYATSVVGWENVICVLNTDYGAIQNMPFDIASRRLTPFSLKDGKSKGEVKRYIKGVIQDNVENIIKNGKRIKSGYSNLRVGCINGNKFMDTIQLFKVNETPKYVALKEKAIATGREFFGYLQQYDLPVIEEAAAIVSNEDSKSELLKVISDLKKPLSLGVSKREKIEISKEDKERIVNWLAIYLGINIDLENQVFYFGNLEKKFDIRGDWSLDGTEDEKNKYKCYDFLYKKLFLLDLWEKYVKTFNDYYLLPLAIENCSSIADENIDIYITYNPEQIKIVYPGDCLIHPKMKGLEGIIYDEGIIEHLLKMNEDSTIKYDKDISFSIEDSASDIRVLSCGGINRIPKYTSDDYGRELRKFIAIPTVDNKEEFFYTIGSLRANERKWLGPAILLSPISDSFELSYVIKSKNSDGGLSGVLSYICEEK